jgi:hypothetical protein
MILKLFFENIGKCELVLSSSGNKLWAVVNTIKSLLLPLNSSSQVLKKDIAPWNY